MEKLDILERRIGVNFNQKGDAQVRVWSPSAASVELVTGNKRLPLIKGSLGYWALATSELKPGDRYQFVLDGKDPLPDPASLSQPDGVHGASETVALNAYQWQENDWSNPALNSYLFYEVHIGTFTNEGSFAALETRLDYLKTLGVTAIEIMPVAQFPGTRNWGYDGVYPFAVQNSYGGPEGLQRLVDACHQKGLAVVLDVVYNHLGPEGAYLPAFGPYFTDKYKTPWGSAINFDDSWCDGVRDFFIENVLMWFRDFRIDALRLDAVHAIKDFSPIHILREIKQRMNELMEATGRKHYLITELDLNDTRFIEPFETGGYAMDAQWVDEFHHALRVSATGERAGWLADFTGIEHLAKAYEDAYVYDGQWSPHRKKLFGVNASAAEGNRFVVFSQNHDQVGNRMLGERTSQLVSFEMQKLLAGAVLVSPFLPMLFMGEEWSAPSPFLYFVDHGDKDLCEAVRQGRKAEFAAFHADDETPDPTDEQTFLRSKLNWELMNEGLHKTMLDYYRHFIHLRKTHPVLMHLHRKTLSVQCDAGEKTLLLHRWYEDEHLYCFMNFSSEVKGIVFEEAASLQLLLDSSAVQWGGPGPATIEGNLIRIQPESILILSN